MSDEASLALALTALAVSILTLATTRGSSEGGPSVLTHALSEWHAATTRHRVRDQVSDHTQREVSCPCGWRRGWGWFRA